MLKGLIFVMHLEQALIPPKAEKSRIAIFLNSLKKKVLTRLQNCSIAIQIPAPPQASSVASSKLLSLSASVSHLKIKPKPQLYKNDLRIKIMIDLISKL